MTSSIIDVDPIVDPRWSALVEGSPDSDVFHSPDWLSVLVDTYGFELRARLVMEGGRPAGGVVFAELGSLDARHRKTLPFSDFCDPLVSDISHWESLRASLLSEEIPFTVRCRTSPWVREDQSFHTTGTAAWHRIDVDRSTEAMWEAIHPSARRAIRRAIGEGVEVRPAEREDELRSFYLLHMSVRRHKYGLLAQPYSFFQRLWSQFVEKDRGRLMLAFHKGRPVAGVMFLDWGDTTYYKLNASDPDSLELRPNDLIVWSAMEEAGDRSHRWLDFGVSDLDQPGLIRYKEKYATESGLVETLVAGDDGSPAMSPATVDEFRDLLGSLTRLFVDDAVPDAAFESAGDLLYRYFA
ncbi:MAG: GNAT family N-acetyltransferase [Acidimicrobiia bacterium]